MDKLLTKKELAERWQVAEKRLTTGGKMAF